MRRTLYALMVLPGLAIAQATPESPVAGPVRVTSKELSRPRVVPPAAVRPNKRQPMRAARPDDAHARVYAFVKSRYGARTADRFAPLVTAKARRHGLPPLLVAKVIHRESSFRPHAELHGCYGLMQVARFHFKRGESPQDPATNLEAGCRLLSSYHRRFGNWPQALTAYNMGPTATASRGLATSRYARMVLEGR